MDYEFLSKTKLFQGETAEEIKDHMKCLKAEERFFPKGAAVCRAGERAGFMGMVLSGSVSIENVDVWGSRSVWDRVMPGQVFGETYACLPGEPMLTDVVAFEDSRLLFLDSRCILHPCAPACAYHVRLMRNLLTISAHKNLHLARRSVHISSKYIRDRLMAYLSDEAARAGSREFDISFNRQQLADYLNVDRSALSNELGKMQRDGLLRFKRSHFCLKDEA